MKKHITLLFLCLLIISCQKDSPVTNNQYLQNVSFAKEINTALPSYNNLQYPSNPVLIRDAGAGIQGIIVMKVGENDYRAWEASCPNEYPTDCTKLSISGLSAKCSCDNSEYNLFTGDGGKQYGLKAYRVEINGAIIRVYN